FGLPGWLAMSENAAHRVHPCFLQRRLNGVHQAHGKGCSVVEKLRDVQRLKRALWVNRILLLAPRGSVLLLSAALLGCPSSNSGADGGGLPPPPQGIVPTFTFESGPVRPLALSPD